MAPDCLRRFLFLCYFLLPLSVAGEKCPTFGCRDLGEIHYPFTNTSNPECGLHIRGCEDSNPVKEVQLGNERWFKIEHITQVDDYNTIFIDDDELQKHFSPQNCDSFNHSLTNPFPMMSFHIVENITLFKCKHNLNISVPGHFSKYNCPESDFYFNPLGKYDKSLGPSNACSTTQHPFNFKTLPTDPDFMTSDASLHLTPETHIEVVLVPSAFCLDCYIQEKQCRLEGDLCIPDADLAAPEHKKRNLKIIIIGLTIGCAGVIAIGLCSIRLLNEQRYNCLVFLNQSRNIYFDIYASTNPECVNVNFGVPVFSSEELEKATNNFDPSRELGSGGFGTVYYGKLKDRREVAIKRLYKRKRDYRHVKQFINEIELLTRLRHRNLVSLYGCTSHQSRELVLVYEYIPNGTVDSHLHGDLAKPGSLPWPVRMKIAIETASALTYLHASDVIHRDVKTNNILLDNNFCVKVADFGISRLSPNDVSHVSTAPQGTMGYVDPEYQESYQLTNKSDVYSFGVVLIELISSLPAVDDTRNIDEIKLANLALKKIQRRAFTELVDPSLGFESDNEFKRMIISVAELAYQCLQRDKELRPSMYKVLEVLQKIESGNDEPKNLEVHGAESSLRDIHAPPPTSINLDEVVPLKNLKPRRLHETL